MWLIYIPFSVFYVSVAEGNFKQASKTYEKLKSDNSNFSRIVL